MKEDFSCANCIVSGQKKEKGRREEEAEAGRKGVAVIPDNLAKSPS